MNSNSSTIVYSFAALLIVAVVVYKFFLANDSPTRKVVYINQELGIRGEVTGYNKARGFKIYLNNSEVPYNFDAFQNEQVKPDFGLGYYLEQGDSLVKSPHSTVLLVRRGGQASEWHFVPPAASSK